LLQVFSLYKPQDSAGVATNAQAGREDQLVAVGKLATKNGGEYCTTLVRRLFNARFYPQESAIKLRYFAVSG
jgi:hypothetical protein